MKTERFTFLNGRGEKISARLDIPEGARTTAYALFAHCFTCTKNIKAAHHISLALVEKGMAVFRFDFSGLGGSEGDFSETNFTSNIDDAVSAAAFMQQELEAPSLLIGHSLGGTVMLRAAAKIGSVKGVATVGAPFDPVHVTEQFKHYHDDIETHGEAEVEFAGRPFTIKKQFIEDLAYQPMREAISGLKCALLILHSPRDGTVGIENAATIFQTAKHPKSFVSLDSADHLLSGKEDAAYAGDIIAAWVARYLS